MFIKQLPGKDFHKLQVNICIVIQVYNEAHVLAQTIENLTSFLRNVNDDSRIAPAEVRKSCVTPPSCSSNNTTHNPGKSWHHPHEYEIIVANNASTDFTLNVAHEIATKNPLVSVIDLREKGRGRAVKYAWSLSQADILSYMDVDLSTDLGAFPALIRPLIQGDYDIAIGSRLLNSKLTNRSLRRETISRAYNLIVKAVFNTKFSDAQCGFKAITRNAAASLLPYVEDNEWFMDTELLVIAEKLGYRIFDLAVRWVEDPDSRVKIMRTALDDLKGLLRLRRNFAMCKYGCALAAN